MQKRERDRKKKNKKNQAFVLIKTRKNLIYRYTDRFFELLSSYTYKNVSLQFFANNK